MLRQLRADLLKALSGTTLLTLSSLVIVAPLLVVFLTGLVDRLNPADVTDATHTVLGVGVTGALGCAFYGSYLVTRDDYYRAMERSFLMASPRVVFASRILVASVVGALFGAVGFALWTAMTAALLGAHDREYAVGPAVVWLVVGNVAAGAFAGAVGCGIGWVVRNYYAGVVVIIVLPSIVAAPMLGRLRDVERFLPVGAVAGVGGVRMDGLLAQAPAGLVLAGWTALAVAAGWLALRRRLQV